MRMLVKYFIAIWIITTIVAIINMYISNPVIKHITGVLVILSAIAHFYHIYHVQRIIYKFITKVMKAKTYIDKLIAQRMIHEANEFYDVLTSKFLLAFTTLPIVVPLWVSQMYWLCILYSSVRLMKWIRLNNIKKQLKAL